MKEFNENPFKKDTPVIPFSNGTDFLYWQNNNCNECDNYECTSDTEETAKCKLAYYVDHGAISGTIPLWVAKDIGCNYNALYQTCELSSRCRKMRKTAGMDMPF